MFLLIASVLFVNKGLSEGNNTHTIIGSAKAAEQHNLTTGLIAIFIATVISGVAGVVVELVLKNSNTNMWMANCQMSIYSLAPAILLMILELFQKRGDGGQGKIPTGFDGFSQCWPWITVFFHGGAGLLVAFVTKYASTIAKSFSGAFSIIITLAISILFGVAGRKLPEGEKLVVVTLGIALLILSTYLYAQGSDKPCRPSSDRDEDEEITQK
jgi:UDP-sugar transporter A1/2/3